MIAPEKERCWLIDHLPGEPDDFTPCFPNRADAEEEFARLRGEDGERYALTVVRQLDAPCWTVVCDGECDYTLDEDEDGLVHFASAAEAVSAVRDYEWRILPDQVHVFCPEDAPGDGQVPPPTPEQQERAGQLRLPGIVS